MACYSVRTFYNVGNFIHNKIRKILFNMTKLFCSKIRFKISVGFDLSEVSNPYQSFLSS